jgi:hypothetical protein
MVASGREVATAATVWSSRGVDVYVMVSPSNARLVNGKTATEDALGKDSLSAAAAEGLREERLNSPGAKTLIKISMRFVARGIYYSRVNDMCDTIEQDGVREGYSCVVDPSGAIGQDSESQIGALKRWHSNIA